MLSDTETITTTATTPMNDTADITTNNTVSSFAPDPHHDNEMITTTIEKQQTLTIKVPRSTLRNTLGNGIQLQQHQRKFLRNFFRSQMTTVRVEGRTDDRCDCIFYAPFSEEEDYQNQSETAPNNRKGRKRSALSAMDRGNIRKSEMGITRLYGRLPMETELVNVDPTAGKVPHLVCSADDFEISFVGMYSPSTHESDCNDLLLYSLRTHTFPDEESDDTSVILNDYGDEEHEAENDSEITGNTTTKNVFNDNHGIGTPRSRKRITRKPKVQERYHTGFPQKQLRDPNEINLLPTDVPLIHYDPVIDGNNTNKRSPNPNAFIPIPASKSLFRQHRKEKTSTTLIPIRFTVMQIDRVLPIQISNLEANTQSNNIISTAVNVRNSIGKKGIRKYAGNGDELLSIDFEFQLADPKSGMDRTYASAYLRYGYYYFLSETIDAKLYAQTDSSSRNVPLLLRRMNYNLKLQEKGEKEFFPLSSLSYVVVKVRPGVSKVNKDRTKGVAIENRLRLEHIFHVNNALGLLSDMK